MLVGVAGIAAAFWFCYFWLEPRLYKHRLLNWYCDMLFPVIMLTLALEILAFAPWHWPTNLDSLLYDVFMLRVNGMANGAHVWTYMTIPVMFALAWRIWGDEWRAFLASTFMVFIHEGVWFIFYYAKYLLTIDWDSELWADATFLILISTFGLIFWRKYSLNKLWVIVAPQLVYDLAWYLIGFPITATNNRTQMTITYGVTVWADALWVNQIEVFGWWLMLATMILWVWLNREAYKPIHNKQV